MSRDPFNPLRNDQEPLLTPGERSHADNTAKLRDKVEDIASRAKSKASEWTHAASETVDQRRGPTADTLDRAASTLHENAARVPGGPRAVNAAHRLADGMSATSSYLREHDLEDMRDDALNFCRRYPAQTLISAGAVGFLLGRLLRRSRN